MEFKFERIRFPKVTVFTGCASGRVGPFVPQLDHPDVGIVALDAVKYSVLTLEQLFVLLVVAN